MKLSSLFHVPADTRVDPASGLPTEMVRRRDGASMVLVPAGGFLMGTLEQVLPQLLAEFGRSREAYECEIPQRIVTLDTFYIDKYEVTNEMYQQFCKATGHRLPRHWENGKYPTCEERHPVHGVDWHDARAYASWAGVCLPTEAQWEKAARGTDGRLFPWGDDLDHHKIHYLRLEYFLDKEDFDALPIVDGCPTFDDRLTDEVGSYPQGASPYGVMDVLGNVWEWCLDWFDCTYYTWGPSINPTGPQAGKWRVLRGCASVYDLHKLRCAYRHPAKPDALQELVGFRCCYNPVP
jgi:formylglycine-generating enzyme required for sulfatase activity